MNLYAYTQFDILNRTGYPRLQAETVSHLWKIVLP